MIHAPHIHDLNYHVLGPTYHLHCPLPEHSPCDLTVGHHMVRGVIGSEMVGSRDPRMADGLGKPEFEYFLLPSGLLDQGTHICMHQGSPQSTHQV